MKNTKGLWIAGAIALVVLLLLGWFVGSYNRLVTLNNNVDNKWAQVETQYQRRIDLIPNLINTVKGYLTYEQQTLTKITELRTQWQNAKTVAEKVDTANQIEGALKTIFAVAENYPDLKASQNFLALQDELANTENKVAVERQRYNDAVKDINIAVQKFPTNVVAGIFGFKQREYFQSAAGSETVPEVKF
ncbi:LemA family protein [Candidatus Woesearchaeota archaeon]|nr:LemA family protein [Candidatus Woesearchaeota archaeon]